MKINYTHSSCWLLPTTVLVQFSSFVCSEQTKQKCYPLLLIHCQELLCLLFSSLLHQPLSVSEMKQLSILNLVTDILNNKQTNKNNPLQFKYRTVYTAQGKEKTLLFHYPNSYWKNCFSVQTINHCHTFRKYSWLWLQYLD